MSQLEYKKMIEEFRKIKNNFMKKTIIISSILIILILGEAFYWFQWRPTEIKKECFMVSDEIEIIEGS